MDTDTEQTGAGVERPQRQRMAPDKRREAILDAALSVFSDLGYTRATLNDVADRLGVTKGCLYHYFESKEQLLMDLVRDRIRAAVIADETILASEGAPRELLRRMLEEIWRRYQEPGHIEVAILALTELPKVPEAGRLFYEEIVARSERTFREVLERGRPCDDVPEEEVRRAAKMIPLMILGAAMGTRLFRSIDPGQFSPEQTGETVKAILMHGLEGECP
jgi:TetR/AcrR family transcriptional regulator, cholesterol catabolism regulator